MNADATEAAKGGESRTSALLCADDDTDYCSCSDDVMQPYYIRGWACYVCGKDIKERESENG